MGQGGLDFSPFRITPPSGPTVPPYGGHWSGNVSNTRYEVFPSGMYSVGDEWRRVAEHIDESYVQSITDSAICGSYISNINVTNHWCASANNCPAGYSPTGCNSCTAFVNCGCGVAVGCQSCTGTFPNTCNQTVVVHKTKYERFVYRYMQWVKIGEYVIDGWLMS